MIEQAAKCGLIGSVSPVRERPRNPCEQFHITSSKRSAIKERCGKMLRRCTQSTLHLSLGHRPHKTFSGTQSPEVSWHTYRPYNRYKRTIWRTCPPPVYPTTPNRDRLRKYLVAFMKPKVKIVFYFSLLFNLKTQYTYGLLRVRYILHDNNLIKARICCSVIET